MRTSLHKFAAVSAVALGAGFLAMQANAQSADPGSRPGDVPGTMQPVPAPGAGPTYNNTAPLAGTGQGASGKFGDRAGDTPGSMPAVPAPATTVDRANSENGRVTSDPGSRKGDVPGTIQPIPQTTGGSAQCQAIYDMADRQACISRTQGQK